MMQLNDKRQTPIFWRRFSNRIWLSRTKFWPVEHKRNGIIIVSIVSIMITTYNANVSVWGKGLDPDALQGGVENNSLQIWRMVGVGLCSRPFELWATGSSTSQLLVGWLLPKGVTFMQTILKSFNANEISQILKSFFKWGVTEQQWGEQKNEQLCQMQLRL